jgi:hypothetical protein
LFHGLIWGNESLFDWGEKGHWVRWLAIGFSILLSIPGDPVASWESISIVRATGVSNSEGTAFGLTWPGEVVLCAGHDLQPGVILMNVRLESGGC